MGRKSSAAYNKELDEIIARYETAKATGKQSYMDADQLADIADRYAGERKFKEAQEAIDYGLYLHSGNTDLLMEQAYLYLDTLRIHQAKEVANSITEEYNTEVKMLKAEINLNEGLLETAKEILNTIDDPDELDNIIDIVYLYLDMGYPEAAKEWLDKANSRYNENEDYIAVTADYLATTNQLETASDCYNRLIDIDPYNAPYWVGLAKCRFAAEDWEKTIEACDFALAADEKHGEAYIYRAHSFFYLNNSDAAIADYKKAMEFKAIAPEMAYMFMGMGYSNKENWQEADECYRIVVEIFVEKGDGNSPLLVDTYTNHAIVSANLGNWQKAHQLCDKARAINPKDSTIYLTEGRIYLKEEADKEAFECFKEALKEDSSAEMWYQIASGYSDVDLLTEAKKCYEEVHKLDPEYADVTERLSILCLMHNEIDDFFKYNNECTHPIDEDIIQDLLSQKENTDEGKKLLQEVWERMQKENHNLD